jgi:hypothetical protein
MKLIVLLVTLSLAACEKSSDVGAMQDEANAVVNTYRVRFEAQAQRLKALNERGTYTPNARTATDFVQIGQVFADAQKTLSKMQNLVRNAPTQIANAAKADDARAKLIAELGTYKNQLEAGHREINRNLDAVESWLAYVELRPRNPATVVPPPPTNPPPSPELRPDQQGGTDAPPPSAGSAAAPVR